MEATGVEEASIIDDSIGPEELSETDDALEVTPDTDVAAGVEDTTIVEDATDDDDTAGDEEADICVQPSGILSCRFTTTGSFLKKAGYSKSRVTMFGPSILRSGILLKTFVTSGV
jgi:hypothetical protein